MAKATLKTVVNDLDVEKFLDKVQPEQKRDDCREILQIMSAAAGEPARMWGSSIVGFGTYHYKYDSGREGDMCVIGFSPRKQNIVLYLDQQLQKDSDFKKLGKVKTGAACVYLNSLKDVDKNVLKALTNKSVELTRSRNKHVSLQSKKKPSKSNPKG